MIHEGSKVSVAHWGHGEACQLSLQIRVGRCVASQLPAEGAVAVVMVFGCLIARRIAQLGKHIGQRFFLLRHLLQPPLIIH